MFLMVILLRNKKQYQELIDMKLIRVISNEVVYYFFNPLRANNAGVHSFSVNITLISLTGGTGLPPNYLFNMNNSHNVAGHGAFLLE